MDISFIIPTHNAAFIIQGALQQLTRLQQQQYEIIVSDNGSTDGTGLGARLLADKVITRPADVYTTLGECCNRGARVATGAILWFLDPKVHIHELETTVDEVVHYFQEHSACAALQIRVSQEIIGDSLIKRLWLSIKHLLKSNHILGQSLVVRRSAFERLHGFNPTLAFSAEDDLWQRLKKFGDTTVLWHRQLIRSSPVLNQLEEGVQ